MSYVGEGDELVGGLREGLLELLDAGAVAERGRLQLRDLRTERLQAANQ